MPQATSLNQLRDILVRKGLPADYIRNTLNELRDHLADAGSDSAERLGDPKRLAKKFVKEYRAGSFAGRHPVISSLILALITMQILVIGYYISLGFLTEALAMLIGIGPTGDSPIPVDQMGEAELLLVHVTFALGAFLPFVAMAWLGSRLVKRMGRGSRAATALFAGLALLSTMCFSTMTLSQSEAEFSSLAVGYCFPPWNVFNHPAGLLSRPFLQAAIVILAGWLFCRPTPAQQTAVFDEVVA